VSVHEHISGNTGSTIFTKFCVHISCDRRSVLIQQCGDTLSSSGFMDDVAFCHSGPDLVSRSTAHLTAQRCEIGEESQCHYM